MPNANPSNFRIIKRGPLVIGGSKTFTPTIGSVINIVLAPERAIKKKWSDLGGSPGQAVSTLESVDSGNRIRYEHGAIYARWVDTLVQAFWVYGAIGDKYEALGGAGSWLGLPTSDELPFADGGRVSVFEHGSIYWWPDVGAIALNDVAVHYTGLICFGETDWDQSSDSDEPYVILGMVYPLNLQSGFAKGESSTMRSGVYSDVDSGESRPDLIELYRGKPYGLNISGLLMEHDDGDPDKYKVAMQSAVGASASGVTALLGLIPVAGPTIAAIVGPLLAASAPTVASELNELLDTGDDQIGQWTLNITAKELITLAGQRENSWEHGVGFKLVSPMLTGGGASYKVYFGVVPV